MLESNKKKPLVSIVMPLYNYEKYVIEAIQSVITQTYTNGELIIVDDCSTDNSYDIVDTYLQTFDINLKNKIYLYYNEINKGKSRSVNFAVNKANGYYIFILDADDILANTFLEEFTIAFISNNVDVVTCWEQQFDKADNIVKPGSEYLFKYSLWQSIAGRIMFTKQAFVSIGGYLETIPAMVDYEFSARLVMAGFNKSKNINKILYFYRKHTEGLMLNQINNQTFYKAKMILNSKQFYNKYYVMGAKEVLTGNIECTKLDTILHRMPNFIDLLAYFEKNNGSIIKKELNKKKIPLFRYNDWLDKIIISIQKKVINKKISIKMPDNSIIELEYTMQNRWTIGYR